MAARSNTREEIIRKGSELIHAQGYKATGIQQILNASSVPKGSFYFYFKSKEDFGPAVIDHFTTTIVEIFMSCLNDTQIPPIGRLEKIFEYYESILGKSGCTLGCPIRNLSLELADTSERLREYLKSKDERSKYA